MPGGFLLKRLAVFLFLALVVWITLTALLTDVGRVTQLLSRLSLRWLLAIVGAVLFNYALRFLKWSFFLRLLEIRLSLTDSLWIFFSAFTMILSPGKVGELVKSVLIRSRYGIPAARTAPIVMAERLTDLLGLTALAAIGYSRYSYGGHALELIGGIIAAGTLLITRPRFWILLDRFFLSRLPRFSRLRGSLLVLQESTANLLSLRSLAWTVPLSALSWAGEGFALYFIFQALGVDRPDLLGISLFAHAFGSILGAVSFLPGGLGVTETTMGGFFVLVGFSSELSVSATLLIRALTLWFGVLLGTIVYLFGRRPGDVLLMPGTPVTPSSAATSEATSASRVAGDTRD
ncbi:MAG TPA: lysylphosphatidylglycerol synthase transmembrane domain-containing protein [Candidatus Ozemobacteraceae bacterium]|nr:lysylphosphatidylglycerol synthase transmembrane domain-containing protein [Candidatus Ozemobacteraceae bacterium]